MRSESGLADIHKMRKKKTGAIAPRDAGVPGYREHFLGRYPQHLDVADMGRLLISKTNDHEGFLTQVGEMLRRAIDEVIDMPRTGRWSVTHLHKTEKTYLGTKVEIHLRHLLCLPWGTKLDLLINGIEVDIKHTVGENWAIPSEAVGELCLLVKEDDAKGQFSLGLVRASLEYLSGSTNKDGKRTINRDGRNAIYWLAAEREYVPNFFESLSESRRNEIISGKSGQERVCNLFRLMQGAVIRREVLVGTGQQEDALKRVRRNGGARDVLEPQGIYIVNGRKTKVVSALGIPAMRSGDFISLHRNEIIARAGKDILATIQGKTRD